MPTSIALRSATVSAIAVLLLAACASAPPNRLTIDAERGEMPITWVEIPRPAPLPPLAHGAIVVPVRFAGIEGKPLYMQFDVGTPATVLYAAKWTSLAQRLGGASAPDAERVENLRLMIGTLPVTAAEVQVRKNAATPIDWAGDGLEIVGTVGSDIIDGRTVLLDFKANTIVVTRDRNAVTSATTVFTPFRYIQRKVLMPAKVNGEPGDLVYDSGSSAFALITSEEAWRKLARADAVPVQFPVRSWNNTLTAHTVASDARVALGQASIPVREVSRIEGASFLQDAGMRVFGIAGMIGNELFIGRRLILDTARQEFAVED
ncbi:hypothetical protein BWI17_06905 [Betaproteobacteria bacterium GR16-43]|nr:hypothetical protein BWI17_06905 [Betaproteobacteria bacterium GR16-43]